MLNQQKADIFYVSDKLSHVYLAQYGQYFPRFSYFAFISSRQNMRNSENIGHVVLGTVMHK